MLIALFLLLAIPFAICFVLDIAFLVLWWRFAKIVFKVFFWILGIICWILFVLIVLLLFIMMVV